MSERQTYDYRSIAGSHTLTYIPPNICPVCNAGVPNSPNCAEVFLNERGFAKGFATITRCYACESLFFTSYKKWEDGCFHEYNSYPHPTKQLQNFSNFINTTYPAFVTIYHQSEQAEQDGLTEICGVGYRKAVEFLVKDYLILKIQAGSQSDEDKLLEINQIKSMLLSQCISRIDDVRIKTSATKATWLGNDETHYTRKYENRDVQDLKKFISAMVQCIELEHTISEIL